MIRGEVMTIEKAIEIVKDYQGIVYKQLETFRRFRKNKFIKVNEEAHKEIDDRYIALEVLIKLAERDLDFRQRYSEWMNDPDHCANFDKMPGDVGYVKRKILEGVE